MGFGQAISGIGQDISEFGSIQDKLRQQMEQMAELRRQKLLEDSRNAASDKRAQDEADRKSQAEERALKYADVVGTGEAASAPTGTETDESATLQDQTRIPNVPLSEESQIQAARKYQQISPEKDLEFGIKSADTKLKRDADMAFTTNMPIYERALDAALNDKSKQKGTAKLAGLVSLITKQNPNSAAAQKFIDNIPKPASDPHITINPQTNANNAFNQENTLRDEFNKKTLPFETAATAYQKLDAAIKNGNSADSYAAIIDYVKTLDPGSTVREGEYTSAKLAGAGGAWGKFKQWAENIRSGEMTDDVKKNILQSAKGLITAEHEGYKRVKGDYKRKVNDYKKRGYDINESAVLTEYPELEAIFQEQKSPVVEVVQGGNVFDKNTGKFIRKAP
jgi:hypothetical protein